MSKIYNTIMTKTYRIIRTIITPAYVEVEANNEEDAEDIAIASNNWDEQTDDPEYEYEVEEI